jgi:hypothetical protein
MLQRRDRGDGDDAWARSWGGREHDERSLKARGRVESGWEPGRTATAVADWAASQQRAISVVKEVRMVGVGRTLCLPRQKALLPGVDAGEDSAYQHCA